MNTSLSLTVGAGASATQHDFTCTEYNHICWTDASVCEGIVYIYFTIQYITFVCIGDALL
jgi:hypothetical protein